MGLRINTNISSLNVQRKLQLTTRALAEHTERVASGFRINKAADDAAGLAISEKLKSEIRSLTQAKRNNSDGVSLIQTAEGGLNEISNILGRLKELSVQAASDTISNQERVFVQKEFRALKDEIDRIARSTEYNGTKLLTGGSHLMADAMDEDDEDEEGALKPNKPPLEIQIGPSYHKIFDDLSQRNPINVIQLHLERMNVLTTQHGGLGLGGYGEEGETRVDTKGDAQTTINRIDDAIEKVNEYRAELGAVQNRMGYALNNTSTMIENLSAANSRIRDTDYAAEQSQVVQHNILQQAGVSVLSQANQIPAMALKLLGSG